MTPEEAQRWWDQRVKRNTQRARVRTVPFPTWPNEGKGWCRWCGEVVLDEKTQAKSKRASWHKGCLQDFYLHSRLEYQFAEVERRDGLRCAWPGCGASPERWHHPDWTSHCLDWSGCGDYPEWWPRDLFKDIPWAEQTEEQRRLGWYVEIERRTALQLDHRVPLWSVADLPDDERRWYFGPGNLWLLCPDHHKAKTKAEAAERARLKRLSDTQTVLPLDAAQGAEK